MNVVIAHRLIVCAILTALWPRFAPPALAQDQHSFSVSNVNARYGWTFQEPDIADWRKPGALYVGVDWVYWHNKYGISGLNDNLVLPVLVWVL